MSSDRPARIIIALSAGAAAAGAAGAASTPGVATPGGTSDDRLVISSSESPSNGSKFGDEVMGSPRLDGVSRGCFRVRCTKAAGAVIGVRALEWIAHLDSRY